MPVETPSWANPPHNSYEPLPIGKFRRLNDEEHEELAKYQNWAKVKYKMGD